MATILFNTRDYWYDDVEFAQEEWYRFKQRLIAAVKRDYCILQGKAGTWNGDCKAGFCGDIEEAVFNMVNDKEDFKFEDRDGQLWAVTLHHDGLNEYHVRSLTEEGIDFYEEGIDVFTKEKLHDILINNDDYSEEISMLKKG